MPATMETPTLSRITSWSADHLRAASAHWSGLAERWEDAFVFIAERTPFPGGVLWEGTGAAAAVSRTTADRQVVSGIASQLYAAARIAREGAEDVDGARQLAIETVEAARAAGFTVREDLSVVAPRGSGLLHDAQLQAQAQVLAADIVARAGELLAVDTEVAAQITAAVAELGAVAFGADPVTPPTEGKPRIQAVDRIIKQAPGDGPSPSQPSPPDPVGTLGLPNYNPGSLSNSEARKAYTEGELRLGELGQQWLREGMSPERVARQMSEQRNALRTWSRDIMADRGRAARITADNPNLTWDQVVAKYSEGGRTGDEVWHEIIDSATRSRASVNAEAGVNPAAPGELPPIRPSAPFNVPPMEPPPAVAEPVVPEAPPGEGGGSGGMFGGPGMQLGPHVVPAPHSIPHPFPILGEDDLSTPAEDFEP